MSLENGLANLSDILNDLVLTPDGSMHLKGEAQQKYQNEYYSRYRMNADHVARISADKVIWSLCEDMYDLYHQYGMGELSWPQTKKEKYVPAKINDAVLVPISSMDDAGIAAMVNWATLYSHTTVFVLPINITSLDISYSGAFGVRTSYNEIQQLLYLNKRFEPLITSGRGLFLPSSTQYSFTSTWDYSIQTYSAPFEQSPEQIRFIPLNLARALQGRSLLNDLFIYKIVSLPYFSDLKLSDVISLAQNETDAFTRFNHFLNQKLSINAASSSFHDIQICLNEIEYELSKLNTEIERISKLRILQKAQLATLVISLGALMLSDVALIKSLAGIAGSVNLFQLIEKYVNHKAEQVALKKSDVYLLYLLRNHK